MKRSSRQLDPAESEEAVRRQRAEACFYEFVRQAWHVVESDTEFKDGWHIRAICWHLEAVAAGKIKKLLINVPPGAMKSLLVSVFWPAWVWSRKPGKRFMGTSYDDSLVKRDAIKCRNLLLSEWYQTRWPTMLAGDMNQTGRYGNTSGGWRICATVGGKGTGEHPDFLFADDPHDTHPKAVESDAQRAEVIDWWDGKISSRGKSRGVAQVVVMQRLHPEDLSGHVLKKKGWTHLCLPMRYEEPDEKGRPRMRPTPLGFQDPRKEEGELLWPSVYTEPIVSDLEIDLGPHHAAGQLQQRPTPRGGGMFKREWLTKLLPEAPRCHSLVRYWDKAGTAGGTGARSAGVLVGLTTDITVATGGKRRDHVVIVDVVADRWSAADREAVIAQTAALDNARYGHVTTWIEQEPGSGGKESAENTVVNLGGFTCYVERVTGSKTVRAEPLASQCKIGNVSLVAGKWTQGFVDEAAQFPAGGLKDQVDAAGGAYNKLAAGTGAFDVGQLGTGDREGSGEDFFSSSEEFVSAGQEFFR